ncbi:acyl-CoA thioester hydrolase [Sinobaca qinghaiensis]|uniref:Acyl-CoA thioester hydrolase n=1 Tax=Sinobaca qinghaiensis TaxID=342944 RepID=A0A419V766_9BACL|nr:thioesterase family protein [Sinobaca qinghaiensis]RKD75701.1 acyl-CoA thioester hydrolase [Sinobaca qinghaiensis]
MGTPSYIGDWTEWEKDFSFYNETKVRFSETDAFGHLNNTNAFVYFEEVRLEFFKKAGLMQQWLAPDSEKMIVVADMHCDYIKQVYFDESLNIYMKIARIGNSSADVHYLVKNKNGENCLTGRGAVVQISKETGSSLPWSDDDKERMNSLQ